MRITSDQPPTDLPFAIELHFTAAGTARLPHGVPPTTPLTLFRVVRERREKEGGERRKREEGARTSRRLPRRTRVATED